MRIALVADAYSPLRSSAAVQMQDLAHELARQGHFPTVMVPGENLGRAWTVKKEGAVEVLRIAAPRTKDTGHTQRVLRELVLPYVMLRAIWQGPMSKVRWDGLVWYSPSIFLGPLVSHLKRSSGCPSYLILRDLFPEWAADARLMSRGPAFNLLKRVARYQYSLADTIGVQSAANVGLFNGLDASGYHLEVLHNWLAPPTRAKSPISVKNTSLAGRKIFVYCGNMGVSQDMPAVLGLVQRMQPRKDAGFLFVGRGTEAARLRKFAAAMKLDNVEFHDEIEPWEVPGLLTQCDFGIVALDPRHTTHNVPGKFVTYIQAGLPVLARLNSGNDLEDLITEEGIGLACTDSSIDRFYELAIQLLDNRAVFKRSAARGKELARRMFSVEAAAAQIVSRLQHPYVHH